MTTAEVKMDNKSDEEEKVHGVNGVQVATKKKNKKNKSKVVVEEKEKVKEKEEQKQQDKPKPKKKKTAKKDDNSDDDFLDQMIKQNQQQQQTQEKKQIEEVKNSSDPKLKFGPAYYEGMNLEPQSSFSDNSIIRNLGNWPEGEWKQTTPPTIPIDVQFPNKSYPKGVEVPHHGDKSFRISSEEYRQKDLINEDQLISLRKAAECHRQVRKYAQTIIRPGQKYFMNQYFFD